LRDTAWVSHPLSKPLPQDVLVPAMLFNRLQHSLHVFNSCLGRHLDDDYEATVLAAFINKIFLADNLVRLLRETNGLCGIGFVLI
jgi:hypothetical protein